ncbi:hypothetical protein [Pantoea stewartii]|uniref:hypothetical protein n=1 Tax=Pantoea stewartii TaxID=66269 RepID=UPI003368C2FD
MNQEVDGARQVMFLTGTMNLLFQGGVLQFLVRFSTHYNAVNILLLLGFIR